MKLRVKPSPIRRSPVSIATTDFELDAVNILAGFAEKRRQHLMPYVEGGRRILAGFLDTAAGFDAPYLDGAISALERYLSIGDGYLKNIFQVLDRDGDGCLDRAGFHDALDLFELGLSREEKNALFEEIDTRGDGTLDMTEVLAAFAGDRPASPLLMTLRTARSPR